MSANRSSLYNDSRIITKGPGEIEVISPLNGEASASHVLSLAPSLHLSGDRRSIFDKLLQFDNGSLNITDLSKSDAHILNNFADNGGIT